VIPQLSEWVFQNDQKWRLVAIVTLVSIMLSCWNLLIRIDLPFIPLKDSANRNFVFDEFINWLLVPGFTYLLVVSLPDWMKVDLQKLFGKSKRQTI